MLKFKSIDELLHNISEQELIDYLEEVIWNGKPISPFDSNSEVYFCSNNNQYRCKNTGKYFNIKAWTPFAKSRISLRKWLLATYMLFSQTGGISSYQLAKLIGVSQRTAWYMNDRLRTANNFFLLKNLLKLKGDVEVDETYLGGANPNRHWNKKVPRCQGRSWKDKVPILVMVERGAEAITRVVPNVERKTLEPIIRANVKERSNVYTDEWFAYNGLKKWYNHKIVNHRSKQYVNCEASTNSAENFNSHFKRSIYGTYIHISKKNAQKYVSEFTTRYNLRQYKDEREKFNLVLNSIFIGKGMWKGLTYESLVRG